jgi:glycosyltransferase involved in cell wall biosynthesis
MTAFIEPLRVAFLGTYVPRRCGIATFTNALCEHLASACPDGEFPVIAMDDSRGSYTYSQRVRFQLRQELLDDYFLAAKFLRTAHVDLLCVQHEYGIYGGEGGSHLLSLLRNCPIPVVTTAHTVLRTPDPLRRRVMCELCTLSQKVIVMTAHAHEFLQERYEVPSEKISVIPHGAPYIPFSSGSVRPADCGPIVLTFGLLSPDKGIEYVIGALPTVTRIFPNLVYRVVGATHPIVKMEHGESYRSKLVQMAAQLGVKRHVVFCDAFLPEDLLIRHITDADVCIAPYLSREQITSGSLTMALSAGQVVISTPFWHAEEALADRRGILVPFRDSQAIAEVLLDILQKPALGAVLRQRAYSSSRQMMWSTVAREYVRCFRSCLGAQARSGAA